MACQNWHFREETLKGGTISAEGLAGAVDERTSCIYMKDLSTTSREHALRCRAIAEEKGLKNVRIGNVHLLS